MGNPDSGVRPYRSRVRRPCDRCRRRKSACILLAEAPCQSCAKASRDCTFDLPPTTRRRRLEHLSTSAGVSLRGDGGHGLSSPVSSPNRPHPRQDDGASPVTVADVVRREQDTAESLRQYEVEDPTTLDLDLLGQSLPQPVQHVCSLDQLPGTSAHLCGISADLDPFLLRHCRYDEYGMRYIHQTRIRNVGGVPVDALVPVHFVMTEDREEQAKEGDADLEYLVPPEHGARLLELFVKYVFPMVPIISRSRLQSFALQEQPIVLKAAIYAAALPFAVHDPVLFVSGSYTESLADWLWSLVARRIEDGTGAPKLAHLQASLLYLQRLPAHQGSFSNDSCTRTSLLAKMVAMAISLGLHLECRPWGIPAWEKRLRRRLWWAVYQEDIWTSLLYGRPPLIRSDECDVLELDEIDFADESSPYDNLVFPHFAKLSQLVESVHQTFYTLKASQRLSNNFRGSIDAARPIRQDLQAWYTALPEDLRFKPRPEGHLPSAPRQGVAVLHFAYLNLELFLYRAILRPLAKSPTPPPISPEDTSAAVTTNPVPNGPSPASWFLDHFSLDLLELDQLPAVEDFPMFGEASEATVNAAEKCAGIIVSFVATLTAQDFDVHWYSWISVCFATVTNFIGLLLVQAPTTWHAQRAKELLDRWSVHLQAQHKSHQSLMRLGLVRLHSLQEERLDRAFMLSPSALDVVAQSESYEGQ